MLIIFLSVIILYSFPDNACTSHIADKGTLIIPKRQDDSFRGSDSDSAGNLSMTVNEIQNKLSKINDITGRFSQTSYIKDLEQTQKYSGSFFIKKPFQMMWEGNIKNPVTKKSLFMIPTHGFIKNHKTRSLRRNSVKRPIVKFR